VPDETEHGKREFDLQRYLRTVRERGWVLVVTAVLGAAMFAVWASRQVRIYQATATVIVDRQPPQVFGGEVRDVMQMGPGEAYYMQDYIQTQRHVVTSDSLVRRAIDRLKLGGDRTFWGGDPPATREAQVEAFAGGLAADAVVDTHLISVTFLHSDPVQAKRAVDGVVDEFIESNVAERDVGNVNASRFLATQADELRKQLADSELALYEFKRKNDLLSVALEDRINNVARTIDKLNDALTEARLRKVARSAEAEELGKMVGADPSGLAPAAGDPLGNLKHELVEDERRLGELKARYQEAHPLVQQQAAKVAAVQAALHREVALQLRAAQARTNEALDQEKKIAAQLETAKQEGLRITRLEVEYNKLKREADAVGKQYVMVQNRTKEAELAAQVKVNNLRVLDYARVPTVPVSPHVSRAAMAAAVLSLVAGLLLAFLLDALDRSIKTPADVEARLGLPFLGTLPRFVAKGNPDRVVAEQPQSPVAEHCRLIRTNLMFAGLNRQLRRFLVTSPVSREGKTLTCVSLGIVMAQAGQKVLLIDADLRRPRLQAALGLDGSVGLTSVLLGAVPLAQAIQPTGIPNLSALCAGPVPPNPAELVDGARFRELLDECAEGFERVLIDSPPALPVTDPAILSGYCDGVVMVVRSGHTTYDQAQRAVRNLVDVGARLLGVVLNDSDVLRRYAGYSYENNSERLARRGAERARG
jgi:capsular exopolysaccharide synthesis family protein